MLFVIFGGDYFDVGEHVVESVVCCFLVEEVKGVVFAGTVLS